MYFKNIKCCLQFYDTKIQGYVSELSNFVNEFFLTYWCYLGIIVKQSIVVKKKGGKNMDNDAKNEILSAISMIGQKVDDMQDDVKEMKKQVAKIPEIEKQLAQIPAMEKQIAKIPKMEEEIKSISRSVAVIENEHGDKLKALFDAFTMTMEKAERQEKKNKFFENKLEKHEAEIYYLNTKVQGL